VRLSIDNREQRFDLYWPNLLVLAQASPPVPPRALVEESMKTIEAGKKKPRKEAVAETVINKYDEDKEDKANYKQALT
jgi:hypothetical protein